jgi:hypothetical protein
MGGSRFYELQVFICSGLGAGGYMLQPGKQLKHLLRSGLNLSAIHVESVEDKVAWGQVSLTVIGFPFGNRHSSHAQYSSVITLNVMMDRLDQKSLSRDGQI